MSGRPLRAALAEYLAVRRSLGFKLARDGLLLEQFAGFCEQAGASRVTSELALAWVSAPAKASAGWLGMRLTVVRGFASWLQASDPATEVPPLGWLPPRRRTAPYLYSADDVAALLAAARRVRWPLGGHLRDAHLPACGDRHANRGSYPSRPLGPVARRGPAHHLGLQVRHVPAAPAPPEHGQRAGLLPAPPRGAITGAG